MASHRHATVRRGILRRAQDHRVNFRLASLRLANFRLARLGSVALLGLVGCLLSGCAMCCGPYDYIYPTFGGKHQRADAEFGRVGSIYSDPFADPGSPPDEVPERIDERRQGDPLFDFIEDEYEEFDRQPDPPAADTTFRRGSHAR